MQTSDGKKKAAENSHFIPGRPDQRCSSLQNREPEKYQQFFVSPKIWHSSHFRYFLCASQKLYVAKL